MVDAYDASLTKTRASNLGSNKNRDAAATVGNHAVFVGSPDSADIYDASLTRTSAAILSTARTGLAATTVGNYAIFSGGGVADVCDTSLTRSSIDTSMTGYDMGAATSGITLYLQAGIPVKRVTPLTIPSKSTPHKRKGEIKMARYKIYDNKSDVITRWARSLPLSSGWTVTSGAATPR